MQAALLLSIAASLGSVTNEAPPGLHLAGRSVARLLRLGAGRHTDSRRSAAFSYAAHGLSGPAASTVQPIEAALLQWQAG